MINWRCLDCIQQVSKIYSPEHFISSSTVAVADFTVTKARSGSVTFLESLLKIHHSIFIQNPREGINMMAYVQPLHRVSWLALLCFCSLTPPLLFASAW